MLALAAVLNGPVRGDADLARHVVPHEVRVVSIIRLLEKVWSFLLLILCLSLLLFRYPMTGDTLLKVKLKSSDL